MKAYRTVTLNSLTTFSLWSFIFSDSFEMVSEDEDGKVMFKVNYHYMSQVKNASDTNSAARSRRLAQEAVTLSTSLPLSSSSSVFVRCDEERLDIMKKGRMSRFMLMDSDGPVITSASPLSQLQDLLKGQSLNEM